MLDCYLVLGQTHIPFIPGKNKTINLTANTLAFNYLNYLLKFLRTRTDLRVSVYWRIRNDGNKVNSLYARPYNGRCPCPRNGCWKQVICKVLSDSNHSMILGYIVIKPFFFALFLRKQFLFFYRVFL